MMDLKKIELEAKGIAIKAAQLIAAEANKREEPGVVAGTAASITFQNVAVSLLIKVFKPGSAEGELQLRAMYEQALKDAVDRWHRPDLNDPRLR